MKMLRKLGLISQALLALTLLTGIFLQPITVVAAVLDIPRIDLDRQYDWTIFLEALEVESYLNYKGSKLHPLTKVRVFIQKSPRGNSEKEDTEPFVYEDFWYFNGKCIGMHRKHTMALRKDSLGAIVLRKCSGKSNQALAATNAALRVLVDLQQAQVGTNILMVSPADYEEIAGSLSEFGFYRGIIPSSGKQLGLDLHSYPHGKDERFYLLPR